MTNQNIATVRRLVLVLLPIFISFGVHAHERQWPEKRLRQVWPQAQKFTSRQMTLDTSQIAKLSADGVKIGSEDRSPIFYIAQGESADSSQPKALGVITFVDEYGANGKMEISVAMDADGRSKKVDIWEHSENSAISKSDFLNQFVGKTISDSLAAGKDYKSVPGALKASEAVASAVTKALKITNVVFEKK